MLLLGLMADSILEVDEIWVYTTSYTVTQADIDLGIDLTNTASVLTDETGATPVDASAPATPITQAPSFTVEKVQSGGPNPIRAEGDVLEYTITLINDGNVSLNNVVPSDTLSNGSVLTLSAATESLTTDNVLEAGETWTYTTTYSVTQSDINLGTEISNTVSVVSDETGVTAVDDTTAPTPIEQLPSFTVNKTQSGGPNPITAAGDVLEYTITVVNNGNVSLNNVVPSDTLSNGNVLVLSAAAESVNADSILEVGETWVYTTTYSVTQNDIDLGIALTNNVSVTSDETGATPVDANTTATPITQTPSFTVNKEQTGGPSVINAPGEVLEYTITLVNDGNVSLNNITPSDTLSNGTSISLSNATETLSDDDILEVGETWVYTASYSVVRDDFAFEELLNTVSVLSDETGITPVIDSAETIVVGLASLSGSVWFDANQNDLFDDGEQALVGWTIEVRDLSGAVIASVIVDANGNYSVPDLLPNIAYDILAIDPNSGSAFDILSNVVLQPNQDLLSQDFAIDPSGVVYDSLTREAIVGATITIVGPDGLALPSECLLPGQMNPQTSTEFGYRFDIVPQAGSSTCPSSASEYSLQIVSPDGFEEPESLLIPATTGPFDPPSSLTEIQDQAVAPQAGEDTTYYLSFILQNGDLGVINNHIPLDPVGINPNMLRVTKTSAKRNVLVGDLVPYTLSIENISTVNLNAVDLIDDLPAGFSYVQGSATTNDSDASVSVSGTDPITISGVDIVVGETVEVTYLTRVGAAVVRGKHVNTVQPSLFGTSIGNEARATVTLSSDPLLEEATIIGKVWNDRDGDNWQDNADATGLFIQGGFAPEAYVANSTTIDYGQGPQALHDASSPLLHGINIGTITGRRSLADSVDKHRVVISQLLTSEKFTNDLRLTSQQGSQLRLSAQGETTYQAVDEMLKGKGAQSLTIERSSAIAGENIRVNYVISNHGLHEMGVPGVRVATTEGIISETDAFGRYHIAGIDVQNFARGRNFVVKVDPFTLPPNTQFTSENPRVRRLTQGLPTRFDFAVQMPEIQMKGGEKTIELEVTRLMFVDNSAELLPKYQGLLDEMAQTISLYTKGEIYISTLANEEALAIQRAAVIQQGLMSRIGAPNKFKVHVVNKISPQVKPIVTLGSYIHLGEVFFDVDQSTIKPEYEKILRQLAEKLLKADGGVISVIGHADQRGSVEYNQALTERRARAVVEALRRYLNQETLNKINIQYQGKIIPIVQEAKEGGAA